MFLGTYTPKLDAKGRFFLPAKYRGEFTEGMVITRSQERCLAIYPQKTFLQLTEKLHSAPTTLKNVRDLQRMLAAGACDEVPDKQGRVTIPPILRDYAALSGEIVIVGAITRVEVWNPETWNEYSKQQEEVFAQLNEEIFPGLV